MRILWWSTPPWISSGYGAQTKLLVPRLIAAGHEVAICASACLSGGGTVMWDGISVLPSTDANGTGIIGHHSLNWQADITISLLDARAIRPAAFTGTGMRWVPWFPVDSEPVQPLVLDVVRQAHESIVFSKLGERLCLEAGLTPQYVPLGVDLKAYQPVDRRAAREVVACPEDKFVVGMIAGNQGIDSFEAIAQVLHAFARFSARHEDAVLYLHMPCGHEPWAERESANLLPFIQHLGIKRKVILADEYNMFMGFPEQYMANVYAVLDCLVAPSIDESLSLRSLEAQACGCPVVVCDWTSTAELCFGGHCIPSEKSDPSWTASRGGQRVPLVAGIEEGLEHMYQRRSDPELRRLARIGAEAYDVDLITRDYWLPTLMGINERIQSNPSRNRKARLLLDLLKTAPEGPVVEIGCVRHSREVASDGFSTIYLAQACEKLGVQFHSFDHDPFAIDVANQALATRGFATRVRREDGRVAMQAMEPVALLYLDGSDDPTETLTQLAAAPLLPGALVIVDDAQLTEFGRFGKATKIIEWCSKRGCAFDIVTTEPGFASCVLRFSGGKLHGVLP